MSSTLINQIALAVIPVIGLVLPGILKKNSPPDGSMQAINGVIAFVVVLLASIGTAYSANQLQIGNLPADFGVILTGMSSLLAGPLRPLDGWLTTNVLPGQKPATNASQTQPEASPDIAAIVNNLVAELTSEIKQLLSSASTPVTIHTSVPPIIQTQPTDAQWTSASVAATIASPAQVTWNALPPVPVQPEQAVAPAMSPLVPPFTMPQRRFGDTGLVPVVPKQ